MEISLGAKKTKPKMKPASFTNRMGQQYFAQQGVTKTGKPKYFASRKSEGALVRLPKGFIFGESINGVVTMQRPKHSVLPEKDVELTKQQLEKFRHLQNHRIEMRDKSIIIHEPVGMDAIETLVKVGAPSMLESLKSMAGRHFESALVNAAKNMGISVEEFKRLDAAAAALRNKKAIEHMRCNIQYTAIMRFTMASHSESYQAERRCYRGNEDWATLGVGPLEKLLKRYVRHIGKESFFDLM